MQPKFLVNLINSQMSLPEIHKKSTGFTYQIIVQLRVICSAGWGHRWGHVLESSLWSTEQHTWLLPSSFCHSRQQLSWALNSPTNREIPIFGLPTAAAGASCPLELQPCKQSKYLPVGCCWWKDPSIHVYTGNTCRNLVDRLWTLFIHFTVGTLSEWQPRQWGTMAIQKSVVNYLPTFLECWFFWFCS